MEDESGNNAFHIAAEHGHANVLHVLLKRRPQKEVTLYYNTVLCFPNQIDLPDLGYSQNYACQAGMNPLHCAVEKGQDKCVQELIKAEVDLGVNTEASTLVIQFI